MCSGVDSKGKAAIEFKTIKLRDLLKIRQNRVVLIPGKHDISLYV
jgi:hypothetical protein